MLDIATAGWVSLGHLPLGAHEPVSSWHGDAGNGPFLLIFISPRFCSAFGTVLCIYVYICTQKKMKCNDFVKLDSPMLRFDFMLNFGNSYTMIDVSIGILLLRIVW